MKKFIFILYLLILCSKFLSAQQGKTPENFNDLVLRDNTREKITIRKGNDHIVTLQILTSRLSKNDKILKDRKLELKPYRLNIIKRQILRQQRILRQKMIERNRRMLNR